MKVQQNKKSRCTFKYCMNFGFWCVLLFHAMPQIIFSANNFPVLTLISPCNSRITTEKQNDKSIFKLLWLLNICQVACYTLPRYFTNVPSTMPGKQSYYRHCAFAMMFFNASSMFHWQRGRFLEFEWCFCVFCSRLLTVGSYKWQWLCWKHADLHHTMLAPKHGHWSLQSTKPAGTKLPRSKLTKVFHVSVVGIKWISLPEAPSYRHTFMFPGERGLRTHRLSSVLSINGLSLVKNFVWCWGCCLGLFVVCPSHLILFPCYNWVNRRMGFSLSVFAVAFFVTCL